MHENAGRLLAAQRTRRSPSAANRSARRSSPTRKKKAPANEKPAGEWNTYDIVCDGDSVELTVNGLLQNEGAGANPSSGPICLQSEGSPIQFRNVYLEPLGK